jgi:hypothetical protein
VFGQYLLQCVDADVVNGLLDVMRARMPKIDFRRVRVPEK